MSVQYGESGSTKIIEEIIKKKKKLVFKNPPRRRLHFNFNFHHTGSTGHQIILSSYSNEQLDILIFDAIIKLRNNKAQPN